MAAPTIRVGTGILLVAQHDPIVTAKAAATIDVVTGGRFSLGIGFGWNEDEMNDHGVDYKTRRELGREKVLAMRALWTQEEASFDGQYVHLPPSWSWPKPVQPGGPPVLIGGAAGPKLFHHIAEYADGWIPIGGRGITDALPKLRTAFEEAGRDPTQSAGHAVRLDPGSRQARLLRVARRHRVRVPTSLRTGRPGAPAARQAGGHRGVNAAERVSASSAGATSAAPRRPRASCALVDEAGLGDRITVDSAGTSTEELGNPVDRRAVKEAARRGITLEHTAWQFQPEDFDRYDLVLVADQVNLDRLWRRARNDDDLAKLHLLREFDPDHDSADDDIPDPWYGGEDGFVRVYDLMEAACRGLLEHLR